MLKHLNKIQAPDGFVLVTTLIIMALLLLLAGYLSTLVITDINIAAVQNQGEIAYYLAESGLNEIIWKLNNDAQLKNSFETSPNWTYSYNRTNALYQNASYSINLRNLAKANAEILSTGSYANGGKIVTRSIKVQVYKALGNLNQLGQIGFYAGEHANYKGTNITVSNGDIFSNTGLIVNQGLVVINGSCIAVNKVHLNNGQCGKIIDKDSNPPSQPVDLPAVSFDNPADANSLKARASYIYSSDQFANILKAGNVNLSGIIYVTGPINISDNTNLTINGALVSDGDIIIGSNKGNINININQLNTSTPSGLLAKDSVIFNGLVGNVTVNGLFYASNAFDFKNSGGDVVINGGLFTKVAKLTGNSMINLTINVDQSKISTALGNPEYSPIMTINHFEEVY